MKRTCFHFTAFLSLVSSLAFLLNGVALFGQFHEINTDRTASRPIVNNGWVLINSQSPTATLTNPMSTLELYDSRTGAVTHITDDAELVFAGWPDLDAQGKVAYVKRSGGKSLVMYFDGTTHLQISDNPAIPNSPSLKLAKDKVKTGFVRIAGGNVIFRDSDGNIFAYSHAAKSVRKINRDSSQSVNMDDEHTSNPRFAMVRQYQFDGKTLFWMHRRIIKDGEEAEITVLKAEAPFTDVPEAIATFKAWVPPAKSFLLGQFFGPFLVSCGSEAAWQYYPPGKVAATTPGLPTEFESGYIGYYDGTSASTIYGPAPVRMHGIRLYAGHLIWPTSRDKKTHTESIMQYRSGRVSKLVEHAEPPKDGIDGKQYWNGFGDVEFDGVNVLYSMNEVECKSMQFGKDTRICQYLPTGRTGLFTDGATLPIYTVEKSMGYNGGLEYQAGVAAFITGIGTDWNIGTFKARDASTGSSGNVTLNHIGPVRTILDRKSEAPPIVDRFSIGAVAGGCGSADGASVELTGITFHLSATSGVLAELDDITNLELFRDVDRDGIHSPGDVEIFSIPLINESVESYFESIRITSSEEAWFFVRLTIRPGACPCNTYAVSVSAADLEFQNKKTSATGATGGKVVTPEASFGMFSPEEMYGGDYQTGMSNKKLPKKLGIRVEDFAPRCGKIRFTITNPPGVDGAVLAAQGQKGSNLLLELMQDDRDALAEVEMTLGKREGRYKVRAEVEYATPASGCEPPAYIFNETAGQLAIEIVDLSDPQFVSATPITRPDGRMSHTVTINGGPPYDKLAEGGGLREGMTADGDNLVLVRVRFLGFTSNPGGNVDFKLTGVGNVALTTNLSVDLPGTFTGTAGTSPVYESNGAYYALAIVRAPDHIPSRNKGNLRIAVTYRNPPIALNATETLTLHQPPVLLVHGMWSSPATWTGVFTDVNRGFDLYTVDYAKDAAKSFTVLGGTLKAKIEEVLKRRRDRSRISTSQVCVVAHSMGGLVTRQYIADYNGQTYYLPENYGQGSIHKFITLGTPHWGSPISVLVVYLRDRANETVRSAVYGVASDVGADIISGAVDAMCPGSADLLALGETPIPTHTIVGWAKDTRGEPFSYTAFGRFVMDVVNNIVKIDLGTGTPGLVTPVEVVGAFCTKFGEVAIEAGITDLYTADRTDLLVTKVSQIGGIATYSEFDNTMHSYVSGYDFETGSSRVASRVFDLLESPVSDITIFSPKLPAPDIQDPLMTCGE